MCNKVHAGVWDRFSEIDVEKILLSKDELNSPNFLDKLAEIDFIVLAGFLLLIPREFIQRFQNRILNIHPSLLPKYGGKGMYGAHVHHAVVQNQETETGITIHLVNEEYDKGQILFQSAFPISKQDTVDSIQSKIHKLEHEFFPKVIQEYIENFSD